MTEISKHYTKEKGKCDSSKECRICFFVPWNSVRVNQLLRRLGKLCCLKMGWRHELLKNNLFHFNTKLSHRIVAQ